MSTETNKTNLRLFVVTTRMVNASRVMVVVTAMLAL